VGAYHLVLEHQRSWARGSCQRPTVRKDRFATREENVPGFSSKMEAAFARGRGKEMAADAGLPPKICSLYSSAALVCNFFGPWEKQPHVVAGALGWQGPDPTLDYEVELRIPGLRGTPPTLDVLLSGPEALVWGIESKFTEPFQPGREVKVGEKAFRPSYFKDERIWAGLPSCRAMAERLRHATDPEFRHLDAPQLVKHALGLHAHYPQSRLVFLRYDAGTDEDALLTEEVDRFAAEVGREIDFLPLTYQEVFSRLLIDPDGLANPHIGYLRKRYFS
jgi:hypothetical protein